MSLRKSCHRNKIINTFDAIFAIIIIICFGADFPDIDKIGFFLKLLMQSKWTNC